MKKTSGWMVSLPRFKPGTAGIQVIMVCRVSQLAGRNGPETVQSVCVFVCPSSC
jgi:hypothetical protein